MTIAVYVVQGSRGRSRALGLTYSRGAQPLGFAKSCDYSHSRIDTGWEEVHHREGMRATKGEKHYIL